MDGRRICPSFILLAIVIPAACAAADTCECADIADLRNREAEQRAAIQAYQAAISRSGSAAPEANETSRTTFQESDVQPAINQLTASGTNKAKGVTDPTCGTTIEETSACMKVVASQHEHAHSSACHAHRDAHPLSFSRWPTLADYAREEIAACQAEASYVHAALVDLQSKCQLQIEMKSEIRGGTEVAISKATGNVLATYTAPDHQPTTPYKGTGTLQYQTRDAGPPKKVGDPMLMKLAPVCYATAVGSGSTPFKLIDGYLWRSNVPPYEPDMDGWIFEPRAGVYAEKEITGTCGATTPLPGPFAQYGPFARCAEKTTFTVRLRR